MESKYKITAIGSARMDVFARLPEGAAEAYCGIDRKRCVIELDYGEKIPLMGVDYCVGGNGANLSVGMKRLGIEAQLVAELGEGIMAQLAFEKLMKEAIGMEKVSSTTGIVPGLGVVINYQGERTILSYYSPNRPEFPDALLPTEWAYLTSVGENFDEYYAKALSWIRNNNVKLGFNPGGRQIKKGREWLREYLMVTEVLLINKEEAHDLLVNGAHSQLGVADYVVNDIKGMLNGLLSLGCKVAVITDGPQGAYASNGQVYLHMPIVDAPVVERTGAGDAFSTGFLSAIISGYDLEMALKWGTVNSASVIGKIGPQEGLLKREGVEVWLKKMENVVANTI